MNKGLTIVEVLIALSIVGVIIGVFSTALTANLRASQKTGTQGQAVQLLGYIGQKVAEGDSNLLPAINQSKSWDYGQLSSTFADLASATGFDNQDDYKITVTHNGTVRVSTAILADYLIEVCNNSANGSSCIQGTTFGPERNTNYDGTPPLPGIS